MEPILNDLPNNLQPITPLVAVAIVALAFAAGCEKRFVDRSDLDNDSYLIRLDKASTVWRMVLIGLGLLSALCYPWSGYHPVLASSLLLTSFSIALSFVSMLMLGIHVVLSTRREAVKQLARTELVVSDANDP